MRHDQSDLVLLTDEGQWVYDIEFLSEDGSTSSVWQDLEEYRILKVDEDSTLYQSRVEGLFVKVVDPATGERVTDGVTEGLVVGGEEIAGSWNYHLLTSTDGVTCEVIRPPEGLTVVLVNNLVEPFECDGQLLACPAPAKDDDDDGRKDRAQRDEQEPTATPYATVTPQPTATPAPTA